MLPVPSQPCPPPPNPPLSWLRPALQTQSPSGAVPRAADPLPPPAQQPPVQSEPLTTVEIKSRPIASVDASPPQPPAAEEEDKGLFSAIKRIPDLLRSDTPPPSNEAPRPPMPVGDCLRTGQPLPPLPADQLIHVEAFLLAFDEVGAPLDELKARRH